MGNEAVILGYCLGTCNGWNGDVEAIMFTEYKPDTLKIHDWPKEANTINVDLLSGKVEAYGDSPEPLASWEWRDFIKNF